MISLASPHPMGLAAQSAKLSNVAWSWHFHLPNKTTYCTSPFSIRQYAWSGLAPRWCSRIPETSLRRKGEITGRYVCMLVSHSASVGSAVQHFLRGFLQFRLTLNWVMFIRCGYRSAGCKMLSLVGKGLVSFTLDALGETYVAKYLKTMWFTD